MKQLVLDGLLYRRRKTNELPARVLVSALRQGNQSKLHMNCVGTMEDKERYER